MHEFLKPWSGLTSRTHSERIGEYCSISGGGFTKMGSAIHGSRQKKTNQWSREFPLFALSSSDLKQEVHRLVIQPAAKAPPSKKRVHTRLPPSQPPIGPLPTKEKRVASSHSAHEAPLIQIHQYSGACVTSTSSPPPLAIVPTSSPPPLIVPKMTMINDCSWHQTCSWAGQPFPTMHNGYDRKKRCCRKKRHGTCV